MGTVYPELMGATGSGVEIDDTGIVLVTMPAGDGFFAMLMIYHLSWPIQRVGPHGEADDALALGRSMLQTGYVVLVYVASEEELL